MTVAAFGSVKGAPGVSTTVAGIAAAWRSDVVVVEADPSGGTTAARFSIPFEPGVASLAAAARRGIAVGDVVAAAQPFVGRSMVVPAPAGARAAYGSVAALASPLADALAAGRGEIDVLLDVGRLSDASPAWPLAVAADLLVLCTGPTLAELQHLPDAVADALGRGATPELVTVGKPAWPDGEVAEFAGAPFAGTGRVVTDPVAAASLGSGGMSERALRRSRWWRSIDALAASLAAEASPAKAGEVVR